MKKRWAIAEAEPEAAGALAKALELPVALAQALLNRGYRDEEAARRFLQPRLRDLTDPFSVRGVAEAVERLVAAVRRGERIVIYGDYDVDGVTASALLTLVLRAAGAEVVNFIPLRLDEGYGLSEEGLRRCMRECSPNLLVTVDCGTSSAREVARLQAGGVDVIVIDHHEPGGELAPVVALVNPKCYPGCAAGDCVLASVGLAFKLAHALLKTDRGWDVDLREHLDLVALGTVADVVPLVGENRILVAAGLRQLGRTGKVGLQALKEVAGVGDRVTPYQIGFRLGPRLNAAGRLDNAMGALELLLTTDKARAVELAGLLHARNAARQRIEDEIVREALEQAQCQAGARVLVLSDPHWHVGVIGIVAARVVQEMYRPTVVIGKGGKGSCRSINGFSIVGALAECAALLERFGGHEMAAGLAIRPENIQLLRERLNEVAARQLSERDLVPVLRVDAVVGLAELDAKFIEALKLFEPCGQGNPVPVFAVLNVAMHGAARVVGGRHLRFSVTDGERTAPAIWFEAGDTVLPGGRLDVAFTPELNDYGGVPIVELHVRDVRMSGQSMQ